MSALPMQTDIERRVTDVYFGLLADICSAIDHVRLPPVGAETADINYAPVDQAAPLWQQMVQARAMRAKVMPVCETVAVAAA
jgi:hypothetical protein